LLRLCASLDATSKQTSYVDSIRESLSAVLKNGLLHREHIKEFIPVLQHIDSVSENTKNKEHIVGYPKLLFDQLQKIVSDCFEGKMK
jgi:hypothetical protein